MYSASPQERLIIEMSDTLLTLTPQQNCRQGRPYPSNAQWGHTKQILSYFLRFFFWSSGYNKRLTLVSRLYSCYIFLVCWYQVVYEAVKLAGCPEFNCTDRQHYTTTRELELVSYLSSSVGSAFSYTLMIACLNMIYKKQSNAISPYVGLKDMANSKAKIILISWLVSGSIFFAYMVLFAIIVQEENSYGTTRFALYLFSLICEFISLWVGMVSMYAFSCSSFAIGAFAADTLRRIKHLDGGDIDDAITVHRELRSIVRETTDAYSGWFLIHWLVYGVTVVVGFVVVAVHKFGNDEIKHKIYFGIFFALHLFLFIYPCICAAYITSTCAAVPAKVNNTTSRDWNEGHIFKERQQLQLFVSYCSASPVCFKIGRITFTSTLVWFSFFFGGTGLLLHFF